MSSEIGYLLLPCRNMAEISLKRRKSSKLPTNLQLLIARRVDIYRWIKMTHTWHHMKIKENFLRCWFLKERKRNENKKDNKQTPCHAHSIDKRAKLKIINANVQRTNFKLLFIYQIATAYSVESIFSARAPLKIVSCLCPINSALIAKLSKYMTWHCTYYPSHVVQITDFFFEISPWILQGKILNFHKIFN